MSLDESISQKARLLRLSIKMAALQHEAEAKRFRKLLGAINEFLGEPSQDVAAGPQSPKYGDLADAVRSVVFALRDRRFTVSDIETGLASLENAPAADKPALSLALWKMAERSELIVVERGVGRRPTIYKTGVLKIIRFPRKNNTKIMTKTPNSA